MTEEEEEGEVEESETRRNIYTKGEKRSSYMISKKLRELGFQDGNVLPPGLVIKLQPEPGCSLFDDLTPLKGPYTSPLLSITCLPSRNPALPPEACAGQLHNLHDGHGTCLVTISTVPLLHPTTSAVDSLYQWMFWHTQKRIRNAMFKFFIFLKFQCYKFFATYTTY